MKIILEKNKSIYDDLVNNYQLFKNSITEKELLNLPEWGDNSDYSNYEHIDDFLERDFSEEDMEWNKSYILRVPIEYIFSSEESKGGCDRPKWYNESQGPGNKRCYDNLNLKDSDNNIKGFRSEDAQILTGVLRPKEVAKELVWQLVKNIGNGRVRMKLLANRGVSTEALIEVRFHQTGEDMKTYIQREAEIHSTDAGERSGQNEPQKFMSQYRAGRPAARHCFHFMKNNKLNFHNIMNLEGVEDADSFLQLSSISGIKEGEGNGFFKMFGESNVIAAIGTIHRIVKITGESIIGNSPIYCLSQMFKFFTEFGKRKDSKEPLFTKPELQDFFVDVFEDRNTNQSKLKWKKSDEYHLSKFNVKGGLKDIAYINANMFWPDIVDHWKYINDKSQGFSIDSYAVELFVNQCKNEYLKKEILVKVK